MRWKIVVALASWYASAAVVYALLPPSWLKIATIYTAWIGPFPVFALHLLRQAALGDSPKIARRSLVSDEATPAAPMYPKLLDRA